MKILWIIAGCIAVAFAVIGIPLPGLPTVPFLLLAAFCFARGSDRLHDWLLNHPRLGPPIHDWQKNGAIRKPAKWGATACVAASFGISLLLGIAPIWLGVQAATLACVMVFIWTRPSG